MSMTINLGGPGGVLSVARPVAAPSLLLSAHESGRYLINEDGTPVFLVIESAWQLINVLTREDVDAFLDAKQAQGINGITTLFLSGWAAAPSVNAYGDAPYTGTMFQSSPNEDYWAHVDYVVDACRQRGMVVMAYAAYCGFDNSQGVGAQVAAASTAQMQAYGEFLGSRYVDYDNIVWFLWGDRHDAALNTRYEALHAGIQSTDARHALFSAEMAVDASTYEYDFDWMTLDSIYAWESNSNFLYEEAEGAWNYLKGGTDPVPVLSFETNYEGEFSTDAQRVRRQFIHCLCTGILAGYMYGNFAVWGFGYGAFQGGEDWEDHLADDGLLDLLRVWDLMSSRAWHTLVHPSQQADSSFVTAGRGTFGTADWVVATRDATSGATLALCYRQSGSSYTINMSSFAGPVTAHWFDIRSGSLTPATGSPITNSGTHVFNPGTEAGTNSAGNADWLLLLEV